LALEEHPDQASVHAEQALDRELTKREQAEARTLLVK